jgi:hypothetical protein
MEIKFLRSMVMYFCLGVGLFAFAVFEILPVIEKRSDHLTTVRSEPETGVGRDARNPVISIAETIPVLHPNLGR